MWRYRELRVAVQVTRAARAARGRGCQRAGLDCDGSHAGLFCGVLVIVFTITSIILSSVFSADLTTADLATADLTADLTTADLAAADLRTADLTADLTAADLTADLATADVATADLTTADLATADLTTADLTASPELGGLVRSVSSLVLYTVATLAVLVGTCQIRCGDISTYLNIYISIYLTIYRSLRYSPSVSGLLAKLLLVSGQTGVLLYTVGSGLRCHLQVRMYSIHAAQVYIHPGHHAEPGVPAGAGLAPRHQPPDPAADTLPRRRGP